MPPRRRPALTKTRITAPFDGMVGARRVSPGAYVQPGTEITDLARLDNLRVKFSAPERFLAQLKRGSDVTVSTTAYPGQELTGTIEVLEPQIDPATRSVGVVARISNPGRASCGPACRPTWRRCCANAAGGADDSKRSRGDGSESARGVCDQARLHRGAHRGATGRADAGRWWK